MPRKILPPRPVLLLVTVALLTGCADVRATDPGDPWERMNRRVFDDNDFVDRLLVHPLAELYRATIPPGIRDRVADVISNMKEPVILANDVMQGDFDKAGIMAERFGVNTTLGVGGMFDIAGDWDLPRQTGDFGQTLAVWGVGEGPYMVLPMFGPSDLRDAFGIGVDMAMQPWQFLVAQDGTTSLVRFEASYYGTDALVRREKHIEALNDLRAHSLDYYAAIRSAYRQHRRSQIGVQPNESNP